MNDTLTALLNRRSIRSYKPEQISDRDLESMIQAGMHAATAMNQQPWWFTVVQNQSLLREISAACGEILIHSNNSALVERVKNPNFSVFHNAPTGIIISGKDKDYAIADCANAAQNLCVAAHSLGLGSCYIASVVIAFQGPKAEDLRHKLAIPAEYKPHFAVAVGYTEGPQPPVPQRNTAVVNYIR